LGLAAALIILAAPALILRYEKRLLAKAEFVSRDLSQTDARR
jgi:hypothetical protein